MRGLYSIGIALAWWLLRAASAFGHRKARLAVRGRHGWMARIQAAKATAIATGKTGRWLHVHCASVGEYEQAAPLLDALAAQAPNRPILLTFFSPSGREAITESAADHIDYLPWDGASETRRFAVLLDPEDTVLIKYELWPNLLRALGQHGTRIHLVAARFDRGRHPMNGWGWWVRQHLATLDSLHVQDAASQSTLAEFGLSCSVTGDPRADRVLQALDRPMHPVVQETLQRIEAWKGERQLLLIGSGWPGEWDALRIARENWPAGWAFVMVPHDITGASVDAWCSEADVVRTSECASGAFQEATGLVLDQMGCLRDAYRLADLAIVGGGWRAGVHNTLEPAAHGLPVAVGPKAEGFREIAGLHDVGALTIHLHPGGLADWIAEWTRTEHEVQRREAGQAAKAWVLAHRGAADRIVSALLAKS